MPTDDQQTTSAQSTTSDSALDPAKLSKELQARGFDTDPISFYRILSPKDNIGNVQTQGANANLTVYGSSTNDEQKFILYGTYIKRTTPGQEILKTLAPLENIPARGVGFQTVAIDKTGSATFLDKEYWTTKTVKPTGGTGTGQLITSDAYYQFLTDKEKEPGVDVSLNVLRMPLLSDARKNTDEISLFLNYIPAPVANNMVPYLDVEFQLPRLSNELVKDPNGVTTKRYLNRPSILRFLLGSVPPPRATGGTAPDGTTSTVNLLTDADAALISTVSAPASKKQINAPTNGGAPEEIYITGMEMFTTPQTLTNMDTLKESEGRLNDVKPFLPPGILTSVNLAVTNSGLNASKWSGAIEFKIPDKARIVEFSEFVRGASGVSDVTIWITFGWLAPRGNAEDAYAKFINETMLVRYPFTVKSATYSFEQAGIVTLKIDIIGKSVAALEYGRIDTYADDKKSILRQIPGIIAEIKELRKFYTNKKQEAAAAVGKSTDNRIYEIFDAAEAADLEPATIPAQELLQILKDEMARLEAEKPTNEKAMRLMRRLYQLYEYDPQTKKPKIVTERDNNSKNFAKSRFDAFRKKIDDDPFMPSDVVVKNTTVDPPTEKRIFSENLVATINSSGLGSAGAVDNTKTGGSSSPAKAGGGAGGTAVGGGAGGGTGGGGGGGWGAPPVKGIRGRNTFAKIDSYFQGKLNELSQKKIANDLAKAGIGEGGSYDPVPMIDVPPHGPAGDEDTIKNYWGTEQSALRVEIDKNNKAGGKASGYE